MLTDLEQKLQEHWLPELVPDHAHR